MYFSDFKLEAVNTVKRFSNFGFPYVIAPAFSTPAFSTPAIYSRIFHSRIFSAPLYSTNRPSRHYVTRAGGWLVGRLALSAKTTNILWSFQICH